MDLKELRTALKLVGFDMPGFEVRRMEEDFKKNDQNNDGKLSFKEFQNVRFCKGCKDQLDRKLKIKISLDGFFTY